MEESKKIAEDGSDNEDLYNEEFTLADEKVEKLCPYEQEYNEVITSISNICRHIVFNNNNPNRKIKIEEQDVVELMPRIWTLSTDYDK